MPTKFAFALFLISGIASAAVHFDLDKSVPAVGQVTSGNITVPVFPKATLTQDGKATPLQLTGKGTRTKVEFFFPVDLYAVANYVSTDVSTIDPKLGKEAVLKAVREAPIKALQLTLSFNLSADQIKTAFLEALKKNKIPTDSGPMKTLVEQINDNTVTNDVITITSVPKDANTELVTVDMELQTSRDGETLPTPRHVVGSAEGPRLSQDFWKIWFGIPVDDKLVTLQNQLLDQIIKE